jgi:hypothetical protein
VNSVIILNRILFVLFFAYISQCAVAQCVRDEIKVDQLSGKVVAFEKILGRKEPLSNVIVRVKRQAKTGFKTVAETKTDVNGAFSIEIVPVGIYTLEVYEPRFGMIATRLELLSSKGKIKKSSIEVGLVPSGPQLDSCDGYILSVAAN